MSTFFHRPRKSYYSRLVIPKNLLPFFKGRVQCWKSLRTSVLSTAKAKSVPGKLTADACSKFLKIGATP